MSTSKHTLTLHDPATRADVVVLITIHGESGQWRYVASAGGEFPLAHGEHLWFDTEAEVLALAETKAREALRQEHDPRPF